MALTCHAPHVLGLGGHRDETACAYRAKLGERERGHGQRSRLFGIGGQPQADRTWRDTVVVPRPAKGGSTVIRSRFLDYTGVFMLDCHMMNHEELGMVQAVEVYKD